MPSPLLRRKRCAVCPRYLTREQIARKYRTCSRVCGEQLRRRGVRHNHGGKRDQGWQPMMIATPKAKVPTVHGTSWWVGCDRATFTALAQQRAAQLRLLHTSAANFTDPIGAKTRRKPSYADEQEQVA